MKERILHSAQKYIHDNPDVLKTRAEGLFNIHGKEWLHNTAQTVDNMRQNNHNIIPIFYSIVHPSIADNAGFLYVGDIFMGQSKTTQRLFFPAKKGVREKEGGVGDIGNMLRVVYEPRGIEVVDFATPTDITSCNKEQIAQYKEQNKQKKEYVCQNLTNNNAALMINVVGSTDPSIQQKHPRSYDSSGLVRNNMVTQLVAKYGVDGTVILAIPLTPHGTTRIVPNEHLSGEKARLSIAAALSMTLGHANMQGIDPFQTLRTPLASISIGPALDLTTHIQDCHDGIIPSSEDINSMLKQHALANGY